MMKPRKAKADIDTTEEMPDSLPSPLLPQPAGSTLKP